MLCPKRNQKYFLLYILTKYVKQLKIIFSKFQGFKGISQSFFLYFSMIFFVIDFAKAHKLHRKRNSTTTLTCSVTVGNVLSRQRSQIIRVTTRTAHRACKQIISMSYRIDLLVYNALGLKRIHAKLACLLANYA